MSLTVIVVLAGVVFFVGIAMILAMGYIETEDKRAREAKVRQADADQLAAAMSALPRFFGPPQPTPPVAMFNDALVTRLEDYVRLEQTMVAQFVDHPSVISLYQPSDSSARVH